MFLFPLLDVPLKCSLPRFDNLPLRQRIGLDVILRGILEGTEFFMPIVSTRTQVG